LTGRRRPDKPIRHKGDWQKGWFKENSLGKEEKRQAMTKKHLLVSGIIGAAALFIAAGIYAAAMPDVIKMEEPAYKEHKKGVVVFHHKKHAEEYAKEFPDLYKNGCGECHHNDKGKPLTNLKEGDSVKKCIDCHKKPGEVPRDIKKEWRKKKLKKSERDKLELEWHAEALHENCKGCHRDFNKKYKPKKAPTTCTKCHPKKAGDKD
jgi:hypothetical protein